MPKTVEEYSGSASNNRFNPYTSKGISKTLLTPCRQVGLSRKRKTPNSIKNLVNEGTKTPDGLKHTEGNTTPVTSKHTINDDSIQKVNFNSELIKSNRNKSSVSKCLIASDTDVTSLEVTTLSGNRVNEVNFGSDKSINHVKDNIKDKQKSLNNKNILHLTEQSHERQSCSDKMRNSTAEKKSEAQKKVKSKLSHEKVNIKEYSASEDFVTALQENKSKKIKDDSILKEINGETSCTKINLTLNDITKLGTVSKEETIKYNENPTFAYEKQIFDPIKVDHNYIRSEKKSKLKRSLSMKKCSEELGVKKVSQTDTLVTKDCSVHLNSISFNNVKEDALQITTGEIKKLEKQVQEKKELIEDLKRAQIYKKLHDVNKLKDLTSRWKTGCISALNDLLPHLQAHGDIDMATLLKNLRAPEKLITLSENGDLI